MDQKQRDALMNLLREYEHLIAENQALKGLLDDLERDGRLRISWREALERLMNSPAREKYRDAFAPILSEINSAFQDSEFLRLLSKMPTKGPIN